MNAFSRCLNDALTVRAFWVMLFSRRKVDELVNLSNFNQGEIQMYADLINQNVCSYCNLVAKVAM